MLEIGAFLINLLILPTLLLGFLSQSLVFVPYKYAILSFPFIFPFKSLDLLHLHLYLLFLLQPLVEVLSASGYGVSRHLALVPLHALFFEGVQAADGEGVGHEFFGAEVGGLLLHLQLLPIILNFLHQSRLIPLPVFGFRSRWFENRRSLGVAVV